MMAQNNELLNVTIKFLFNYCNDVEAIRHFYTDLIGLNQTHYVNTEQYGYVVYASGSLEFMYFRADVKLPVQEAWADQPGYSNGGLPVTSWAIAVPELLFPAVLERIRQDNASLLKPVPEWRQNSYWGITTKDPMGVTVEVYTIPSVVPPSTTWIE